MAVDAVVTMIVSACPPGFTVQCGDRLLDNDSSEWARLGSGNPEKAAAPAWGSGRASQRKSYGSEQNGPVSAAMQFSLIGE